MSEAVDLDLDGCTQERWGLKVESERLEAGVLHVTGELDDATVHMLAAALEPLIERGGIICVDLSQLRFLGVPGINLLVVASQVLDVRGRIEVWDPPPAARRVIELTGLDEVLDLHHHLPASQLAPMSVA